MGAANRSSDRGVRRYRRPGLDPARERKVLPNGPHLWPGWRAPRIAA